MATLPTRIARLVVPLIMLAASAVSGQAQGVDPLTRGIVVPPPSGRSCSAVPVTETGPALTNLISKLEDDVRRDTQQLRDLDRRFKMNNRELDRLGNMACKAQGELRRKIVTDSFSAALTGMKLLDEPGFQRFFNAARNGRSRDWLLSMLNKPPVALRSGAEEANAAMLRRFLQGGSESTTLTNYRQAMEAVDWISKNAVAMLPAVQCDPALDEPLWDDSFKLYTTNLRHLAGEVYPAFKLFDPLLDEDNWLAATTYFTTRNRVEQWTELNETQLDEWKALTCNLQRHTKTLGDARTKARPTTTNARNSSPTPNKSGVGRTIGTIAAVGVAAGGGLYAYNTYKTSQEETQALLDDLAGVRNTTTPTTTTTTTTVSYNATATRSCTLGPANANPLSSSFIEPCSQAVAGGSCGPTSFTFTVTGTTVRDCGGWFTSPVMNGNTLTAVYNGVCGAGGITVSGTPGGPISGTGTCRGNSYTVTITTTRQ